MTCSHLARGLRSTAAVLGVLLGLAACTGTAPQADRPSGLYADLGGDDGIRLITQHFVYRLSTDPRIGELFTDTDFDNLSMRLQEQFCDLAGGPCTYGGASMAEAHRGMNISHSEFNRLVEVLQDAMDAAGTPVPAQNRLLALLVPMHGDVVKG